MHRPMQTWTFQTDQYARELYYEIFTKRPRYQPYCIQWPNNEISSHNGPAASIAVTALTKSCLVVMLLHYLGALMKHPNSIYMPHYFLRTMSCITTYVTWYQCNLAWYIRQARAGSMPARPGLLSTLDHTTGRLGASASDQRDRAWTVCSKSTAR